jgi:hypothetical protein
VSLIAALGLLAAWSARAELAPADAKLTYDPGTITVTFDGGDIGADMAAVTMAVYRAGALPTKAYVLQRNEHPCSLMRTLGYTQACVAWTPLLEALNPGYNPNRLPIGYRLTAPDLKVYPIRTVRTFSKDDASETRAAQDLVRNWTSKNARLSFSKRRPQVGTQDAALDKVVYDAYRVVIPTGDDAASQRVVQELQTANYPTNNVDYLVTWTKPQAARAFSWTHDQVIAECKPDEVLTSRRYLDLSRLEAGLIGKLASPTAVPTVWVVDEPFVPTPNLVEALDQGLSAAARTPPGGLKCKPGAFKRGVHHASHMGGIIAGDGRGFTGLEPTAKLKSVSWLAPGAAPDDAPQLLGNAAGNLRTVLEANESYGGVPRNIYLIASTFPTTTLTLTPSGQLADPALRDREPPAKSIAKLRPILIAAAGQAPADDKPAEYLSTHYPWAPHNLGDWPNVIVVTACHVCAPNNAKLMRTAGYSDSIVHLAAPGGDTVSGWISDTEIGAARGTSQAAAYVAGVSAAMIARYPSKYAQAETLKAWLQITAWPIVEGVDETPGDAARVAVGVVDPIRAQLDPDVTWMLRDGTWSNVTVGEFPVNAWVDGGEETGLTGSKVRRMVRLGDGVQPSYALLSLGEVPGEVRRSRPLTLVSGKIAVCSGGRREMVDLSEIRELIIGLRSRGTNGCAG